MKRVTRVWPVIAAGAVLFASGAARCEDLDARKTGPQLFEQTCSTCHRSAVGLAKGQSAGSLVNFLRQHYTTGPGPAGQLAAYLLANPGDGRRPRPAAVNPAAPDKPDQPSAQRHPQGGEPGEAARPTASRRHPAEPSATGAAPADLATERQAAPADQPVGHRATHLGGGNKRPPAPGEAKPQTPVAAEAAAPVNPQPVDSTAAPVPAPPATEAPAARAPERADDQPAFSAPTP
jgi:hypothetical protein